MSYSVFGEESIEPEALKRKDAKIWDNQMRDKITRQIRGGRSIGKRLNIVIGDLLGDLLRVSFLSLNDSFLRNMF
ncbi:hypothetical protein D6810_03020 [Candidatus Dojkabacteria bacterium]|uniref:Uncharacterized protein n=1 Tax=Candidatus Dojkabacteria bacterium TaxID=2099670 RepID=A0A3M0YZS7_9BACT|nr:MAG: hypothetical protein D6810_03020 [Candidatus Dojkabacteria bacterium]